MKKLLLILLCLPMIGFGQTTGYYIASNNFVFKTTDSGNSWDNQGAISSNWTSVDFVNDNITSTLNISINPNRKLKKTVDILGRETKPKTNTPLIEIYDDGTVEKRIVIE